ncbi:MAG: IS630 family transposase [Pseudomonadota bacterium]
MQMKDFRKLNKDSQSEVRRRAVYSYLSMGRRKKLQVAKMYQITHNSLTKWIENYDAFGEKSFTYDARGAKPFQNSALNKRQQNWLRKQLINKTPEQFDFPFVLWTRKLVADVIFRKYGIKVDVSTAGEYLKNFGMTPQKPVLKSYKQQPEPVRAWLDKIYPKLAERAKAKKSLIFWGDETAVRSQDQVGKGYSMRGIKPVQTQGGYRFGVHMVSAINNSGNSRFMLFSDKMNGKKFIEFLRRLIKEQSQKIILILDNASYHKSAAVKAWVAKHDDKIELVFLPAYTPELNPDEYLNNALKQKLKHRQKAKTQKELTKSVTSIMKHMQGNKTAIKNIFRHEMVKYAA